MPSVNKVLSDRAVRHAVYVSRLQSGEANAIIRLINQAVPDITAEIDARVAKMSAGIPTSARRTAQLRSLREALRERVSGIKLYAHLTENMEALAYTEAEFQAKIMQATVPMDLRLSFRQPPLATLKSVVRSRPFEGQLLSDWAKSLEASTLSRVAQSISIGLTRSEDIRSISQRVHAQLERTKHEATAITRTAVNHVSAQAREETYAANNDVIKGIQFLATLDERTTMTCATLDGQVFPINEGPRPPMHFNCRSTTAPVLKSWEELGIPAKGLGASTRASMNGQVAEQQNYGTWLKGQPPSVQNEVLGPSRAEAFRKGTTIDKFVDDKFRPLNLSELRQLEILGAK